MWVESTGQGNKTGVFESGFMLVTLALACGRGWSPLRRPGEGRFGDLGRLGGGVVVSRWPRWCENRHEDRKGDS